ncbi:hypothetical protein Hanom_Chr03g00263521 [Helianthus anomalus]
MIVNKVRLLLKEWGLIDVGLSYVGGLTYLLTFKDKTSATGCMEMHANFLHSIFSKFYLWNGKDIPFNWIVTLNMSGVPFIIRDNTLFDRIGGLFGSVIKRSSFSWQDEDNSSGSITVLTSQKSKIEEAVVIKWNEKSIIVWVSEAVDRYLQKPDSDSVMDDSEYESNTESDEDEDLEDVEVFEEGDIRPSVPPDGGTQACEQNPTTEVDVSEAVPVEFQSAPGGNESQVAQEVPNHNACMGNQNLHGDMDGSAHETGINEVALDKVNNARFNNEWGNGPIGLDSDEVLGQPNISSSGDGPTPLNNLGKRNRDARSPPYLGE